MTMFKDFRRLKFLFSLSKNRQIPVPVFFLPRLSYCRMFAFLLTQTREEGLFHGQKSPLANSVVLQEALKNKKGLNGTFFLVCNHYFSNCLFPHVLFRQSM